MQLEPIGIIHSSYQTSEAAPRQGRLSNEIQEIEIFEKFIDGLKGIEDLSHLIILYWLHKAKRDVLQTKPPSLDEIRGVFTTRSPHRPNSLAFSIAEIISIDGNRIKVKGLEALDGSPLLDIKAYISDIDCLKDQNQPRH